MLTADVHEMSALLAGWATGAAMSLQTNLPFSKNQWLKYLAALGVENPDRYWMPGLTMTDGKVDQ